MSDSPRTSDSAPLAAHSNAPRVLSPHPVAPPGGLGRLAAAGIVAAVLVWLVLLKWEYPWFIVPIRMSGGPNPAPLTPEEKVRMTQFAYLNAALLLGLAGGIFAVSMAVSGRLIQHSAGRVASLVIAGAVAGCIGGAIGGCCGQWMCDAPGLHKLIKLHVAARSFAIQTGCWVPTGLCIGLGLSATARLHSGSIAFATFGGAAGGLFGALLYPAISAVIGIVVPAAEAGEIVPDTSVNRLLWLLTAAVCIGIGVAGGFATRRR